VAAQPTMSFPLPQGEKVDVHLVRLADGRLVARTTEELEKIPPGQRGTATGGAGERKA